MTGQSESETDVISVNDLEESKEKHEKGRNKKCADGHQFLCSYDKCTAVFNRMYRLKRHMRQHTGEVVVIFII